MRAALSHAIFLDHAHIHLEAEPRTVGHRHAAVARHHRVAERLDRRTRRHTTLVSSAPAPGSAPVRAITPAFRAAFGRDPGPYAVIGYDAMKAIIAALDEVGPHERRRQKVTAAFAPPPPRGFTSYRAARDPAPPAPG